MPSSATVEGYTSHHDSEVVAVQSPDNLTEELIVLAMPMVYVDVEAVRYYPGTFAVATILFLDAAVDEWAGMGSQSKTATRPLETTEPCVWM
jgi:hypothetical protein